MPSAFPLPLGTGWDETRSVSKDLCKPAFCWPRGWAGLPSRQLRVPRPPPHPASRLGRLRPQGLCWRPVLSLEVPAGRNQPVAPAPRTLTGFAPAPEQG